MDCICSSKYGAFFTIARPFLDTRINLFFLELVFFQDEVKELSSWKFFDWNRFDDRISTPKCNHSNLRIIFLIIIHYDLSIYLAL